MAKNNKNEESGAATTLAAYGEFTMEAAGELEKRLEAGSGKASFFKLRDGRNVIRILPPPKGKSNPFADSMQHYVNLPTGSVSFNCPRFDKPPRLCPVCAEYNRLKNSPHKKDKDKAGEYAPRTRIYVNIIDKTPGLGGEEAGPQVFAFGKSIYSALMKLYRDPDWGNFTHPTEGYDVLIGREGVGKNTEYTVMGKPNSALLHKDAAVMKRWIEGQVSLDRYVAIPSDAEIQAKLVGSNSESGSEDLTAGGRVYDVGSGDDDQPF